MKLYCIVPERWSRVGGYAMSPIDRYSYLKLEFKDFDELPVYITCFMHPDLDKVTMELKGVGMSIRRNVFSLNSSLWYKNIAHLNNNTNTKPRRGCPKKGK